MDDRVLVLPVNLRERSCMVETSAGVLKIKKLSVVAHFYGQTHLPKKYMVIHLWYHQLSVTIVRVKVLCSKHDIYVGVMGIYGKKVEHSFGGK